MASPKSAKSLAQYILGISVTAGQTQLLNFQPLLPGDQVDEIRVYFNSGSVVVTDDVLFGAFANNYQPATVAAAQAGIALIPPLTIPLPVLDLGGGNFQAQFSTSFPLVFKPEQDGRYISFHVGSVGMDVFGFVSVKVFRPNADFAD
jgi:hypothetical protein